MSETTSGSSNSKNDDSNKTKDRLIFAIDIGSSSIRCTVFKILLQQQQLDCDDCNSNQFKNQDADSAKTRTDASIIITPYKNIHASKLNHAANADTGKVVDPNRILELIDDCVEECIQALRQIGNVKEIVGLGFSSFSMNMIGIDHNGSVIGEEATLCYSCRSAKVDQVVAEMKSELGDEKLTELYQATGAYLHSCYALPQLRHFYRLDNKSSWSKVYKWQTLSCISLARWLGNKTCLPISYSEASWTGLLNYRTCTYDAAVLRLLPTECLAALPDLTDFDQVDDLRNGIESDSKYGKRWTELVGTRLFLALGDGVCANVGSKCTTSDRIACTIGTSAAARVCMRMPVAKDKSDSTLQLLLVDEQQRQRNEQESTHTSTTTTTTAMTTTSDVIPSGLFCYRVNRQYVLLGGALTDGGSVIEWIVNLLCMDSKEFAACMKEVEKQYKLEVNVNNNNLNNTDNINKVDVASKTNLTVVTNLSGERSTGYHLGATGAMLGLTRQTTRVDLVKACMEGVAVRLCEIVRLLKQVIDHNCTKEDNSHNHESATRNTTMAAVSEAENAVVVVSGKALEENTAWRQMLADGSGLRVVYDNSTQEGSSRGVAVMIASALQGNDLLELQAEEIQTGEACVSNKSARKYWQMSGMRNIKLLEAVAPLYSLE